MKKILGIIVTYNPDIDKLLNNVIAIYREVDLLVLLDNNSENQKKIAEVCESVGVTYILEHKNIGLGKAYNKVLSKFSHLYKYFVTFDQDTFIPEKAIPSLTNILDKYNNIGAIGPQFSRGNAEINNNGKIVYKDVIIQSCAVFRSSLVNEIGGFDEEYFVDLTDFEYCLRIRKAKFKIAIFNGVLIYHELGEVIKIGKREIIIHNNLRNYYLARNHMKLCKKYFFNFPFFILKLNYFYILKLIEILFIEKNKLKMKYILKGILGKEY
ncbi:hypothetical protein BAX94_02180 [Elizabethkingia meningoseptica]|uniref:Glycosyltransferase 2-like domain-containing protein n=2 Tax=Elizabethkingia meningoseptica TaxID=238 RepID=A0A1T3FHT7_ELIME|nr:MULTISPECIES: glycosyltransferase [Elizabethkingia]AQX12439.1 hypothetical protein BBD35_08680 [Elizabethkingia meningoseptica]MBG0513977.1 glycosyltransferase [Elizabethkingia meningoseptica]MDE5432892.1 glycosyltransferase [Elizabethkingia meningoseptica]MDE5448032.1 glycosyltransferase [Elizabethkingia meningoseptica]MDE5471677.1 glycosyltransferase [Elizabethkingia meningoseptica]